MANSTQKYARNVHGTDPQKLVESITRTKIYEAQFYKEHCFGLDASKLAEKVIDCVVYVSGSYGGLRKPSPFICLILTMLQIQPDLEIIQYLIKQPSHKYLTVLSAFYLRLVGNPTQIYHSLTPLLSDNRKIRIRNPDGKFEIVLMDSLIDSFLCDDRMFEISLPRMIKRRLLSEKELLKGSHMSEQSEDQIKKRANSDSHLSDIPFIRNSKLFEIHSDLSPRSIRDFVYSELMSRHKSYS